MRHALAALSALLAVSPAYAQFAKPQITPSVVPEAAQLLNIEEIEQDTHITLDWRATVNSFETYEYEISYDIGRSTETTTVTLVRLDDDVGIGEQTGTVISGQLNRFLIRPSQIIDLSRLPNGSSPIDNAMRSIILRVFRSASPLDPNTSESYAWNFRYDTKRPPAPTLATAIEGEKRIELHWTPPSPDTDVESYEIVYCPSVSSTVAGSSTVAEELPCRDPKTESGIAKGQTEFSIEEGLANDVPAAVAIRSIDPFGNRGDISRVLIAIPKEVSDFFELYKDRGGAEEGGFCFIATAAHGSYAHPTVQILRAFRDWVLGQTPLGKLGVWSYYQNAPPLAGAVAASPALASSVRVALVPVSIVALFALFAPVFAAGLILSRIARRRSAVIASSLVLVAAASAASPAFAGPRPKSKLSLLGLGLEFKGGPYLPAIADEDVFASTFQESTAEEDVLRRPDANALYTIGLDLQLFRLFGTAGIGGTFGFMQFIGRAYYAASMLRSSDTTVFNLMPLTLTAFYRFDYLADQISFPFVPYVRGGLAYYVWWVTNGTGDIARWRGADLASGDDDIVARGGKLGLTATVGMAFMLNVIEPDAALALFETTSIRGTYVFGEWTVSDVDGFGDNGFDLSDATWNLGLYLEI